MENSLPTIWTFLVLVIIVLAVKFWFTMMTDCVQNEHHHKAFWIITMLVFNVFGADAYLLFDKRKRQLKF